MGTAIVRGLLAAGWEPRSLAVAEADPGRRSGLAEALSGTALSAEPVAADGAVVAVKPQDAEGACRSLGPIGIPRVLSVMAGVPLARIESWLGPAAVVVRAMPNTPALVGAGISAISGGSAARGADLDWAEEVLGAVGRVVRVPESSLDAVTGLSGSGPGYLFYVAEAMIAAGAAAGLPEDVSRALVLQTFAGSARLLVESGEPPEVLRGRVTSPGGTTEAGLRVLGDRAVAAAFTEAVAAAAERSRQLGR
jgi:pyrroline-5-carboxylate reductase